MTGIQMRAANEHRRDWVSHGEFRLSERVSENPSFDNVTFTVLTLDGHHYNSTAHGDSQDRRNEKRMKANRNYLSSLAAASVNLLLLLLPAASIRA